MQTGELAFLFFFFLINFYTSKQRYVCVRTLDRRSCWFKFLNGFLSALEKARKSQVKRGKLQHNAGLQHSAFNRQNSLYNHKNILNVKSNEWTRISSFYYLTVQGGMITQLCINLSAVRKCVAFFHKVIIKIRNIYFGSDIYFILAAFWMF